MRRLAIALFFISTIATCPLFAEDDKFKALLDEAEQASEERDAEFNARRLVLHQFGRNVTSVTTPAQIATEINEQRPDLQVTASASTPGAVSNLDKPDIADLLAIAIERGALTQEKDGTNVTLSTTPYMLLTAFGQGDTPENWEKLRWARRVSIASTFSSEEVTNGDFSSFVAGEVKVMFGRVRSGRDMYILSQLPTAELEAALTTMTGSCAAFDRTDAGRLFLQQANAFSRWLVEGQRTRDEIIQKLDAIDFTALNNALTDDTRAKLSGCLTTTGDLDAAMRASEAQLKTMTDAYRALNDRNKLSASFLFQRDPEKSDYATLKVIYSRDLASMKANLNGEVSFNQKGHDPDGTQLDHIRGYSVEGGFSSGLMAGGRADASLSAKWYDTSGDDEEYVLSAQALLNLRINDALRLPVALTYANRTLEAASAKEGLQFEFGLAALLDQFFARGGR